MSHNKSFMKDKDLLSTHIIKVYNKIDKNLSTDRNGGNKNV